MQPQLIKLSYRQDAVLDYFTPIAANSDNPDSRYDIIVASPEVTLVTIDGVTEI